MVNYKKIIFISLVVTILIFLAGLLLGLSLDDTKISDLVENLNQNELNSESYLVEQDFIRTFGGDICDLSSPRIEELSIELAKLGQTLTKYESSALLKKTDYSYLKRKYFLLEIKTYTLFKNLKEECGYGFNTILYFYDQNQQESLNQGYILDSLVGSTGNVHVFSFDRNFKEPAVDALKLHYDIKISPSIVINNETKKEGLVRLEEIKETLK